MCVCGVFRIFYKFSVLGTGGRHRRHVTGDIKIFETVTWGHDPEKGWETLGYS